MLDSRKSISSKTQNGRHNLPFVPHSAETRCVFRPGVNLKTSACLFGEMFGMVVARRQLQVHTRDFHLLVRVFNPQVGEGDLAIHDGHLQFTGESNLGPLVPAIILGPGLAELLIQFFLQLVVELNAKDFPTMALDLPSGFLIEAVERGVVIGLLGLYETGVNRLLLRHQTMPSQETLSLLGKCEDMQRFFLEGTRATSLQEALTHEVAEITVHSGAVAGVAEVGEVFDCHRAKPAYIGERADLRWPERIRSVAVGILGPFTVRAKRQIAMIWRSSATDLNLRVATV